MTPLINNNVIIYLLSVHSTFFINTIEVNKHDNLNFMKFRTELIQFYQIILYNYEYMLD